MTSITRHLFLDLEDTVITPVMSGWFDTELINIEKVRSVITKFNPVSVHLFSFAIHDVFELSAFNQGTRKRLEEALGVPFVFTPDIKDIIKACCEHHKLAPSTVDFMELCNFWGKQDAFKMYIKKLFVKNAQNGMHTEVALLDDMVFNEHFQWPDLMISGRILNIDELKDPT